MDLLQSTMSTAVSDCITHNAFHAEFIAHISGNFCVRTMIAHEGWLSFHEQPDQSLPQGGARDQKLRHLYVKELHPFFHVIITQESLITKHS